MPSDKTGQVRRFKFLPLSIKLETLGGIATPLVLRGTPLPAKRLEVFTTAADNQSSVELHVLVGESPLAKRCISIGRFQLKEIPPAPRGKPVVRVLSRSMSVALYT
jgi:molecular chaperone DnaK